MFSQVDVAPAVVAPTKSATKPGKREAEEAIENLASAKKQKKDVVAEQKVETKIQNKSKKEETTDEDTSSASESEEEQKDTPVKAGVTSKKQPVATSKNGNVRASKGKLPCSSSDGESSDESESEEDGKPKGKVAAPVKKLPGNVPTKKAEPSDDSESDDSESSDDDACSENDEVLEIGFTE